MVYIWVIIINIHKLIHLMMYILVNITNIHKLIYYKTNKMWCAKLWYIGALNMFTNQVPFEMNQ